MGGMLGRQVSDQTRGGKSEKSRSGTNDFDLAVRSLRAFLQHCDNHKSHPARPWKKNVHFADNLKTIISGR